MSRARILTTVVTFVVLAAMVPTASLASGVAPPRIAYSVAVSSTQDDVVTATLDGTVLHRFPNVERWSSIDNGVVTVTRHRNTYRSNIIGFDAATGARLFYVNDARLPLLADNGRGLVFEPDNMETQGPEERDGYIQSVWYRDLVSGREFKLAQFYAADHYILEKAVSPRGDRVAFTRGNNTFLFEWNVWVVDTDGTGLRRITHDDISNYPAFHPSGDVLAIAKQYEGRCDGALATIGVDGNGEHIFFESTCAMDLQRPVWIGPDRVVTVWWRHDDRGNRPVGLVVVDVPTGEVHKIVEGRVGDVTVSRELGQVAFRYGPGRGQIGLYDIDTGDVSFLPKIGEYLMNVDIEGTDEDAV